MLFFASHFDTEQTINLRNSVLVTDFEQKKLLESKTRH